MQQLFSSSKIHSVKNPPTQTYRTSKRFQVHTFQTTLGKKYGGYIFLGIFIVFLKDFFLFFSLEQLSLLFGALWS